MSTPAPKRRRMNYPSSANSALHRPFKSPFRTPLKPNSNTADGPQASASHAAATPSSKPAARSFTTAAAETPVRTAATPTANRTAATPTSLSQPQARRSLHSPLTHTTFSNPTTRALQAQLARLRADIDTLTQAIGLAAPASSQRTTDDELEQLIGKWRVASRAAAEEVFGGVRDRVNRMGGVGAWREREREQEKWRRGWDEEELVDGDDEDEDGVDDEVREERKRERERLRAEWDEERRAARDVEEERRKEEAWSTGADDDSFTMDMMLKTLNIDLDVIGYDKHAQGWVG